MSDVVAMQEESSARAQHAPATRRLLIPVKNADDAARAVGYAIRRRAEGTGVTACLLHVEESLSQWQALIGGHGAHAEKRRRSHDVFAGAMRMLEGLDIEFAAYLRSGPVVFAILDAAEELDCDEIVVPAPGEGLFRLLSRDIVTTLLARQRAVPVVAVTKRGVAVA
jgi:nucleotide-binding universal stress UspA family protein